MNLKLYNTLHEIPGEELQLLYDFIINICPILQDADIHIVGSVLSNTGFRDMDIAIYKTGLTEIGSNQIYHDLRVAIYQDKRFNGIFDFIVYPDPYNAECKQAHKNLPYFSLNEMKMYNTSFNEPVSEGVVESMRTTFNEFREYVINKQK